VRLDRDFHRLQGPWILLTVALGGGLGGWYAWASGHAEEWPGGSTPVGLTLGIVGGLLILSEFFLWPRKQVRSWRIGRVKHWMAGHIWLGLLTLPLLILHSGFLLGGTLSTVLTVLLVIVVLSGVWGLYLQQTIPKRMLDEVPGETIYSQIEHISHLTKQEAERLVDATCGRAGLDQRDSPDEAADYDSAPAYVVVGAVRSVGRLQGNVLQTSVPSSPVPGSEPLRIFFNQEVRPYLLRGFHSSSPLSSRSRAEGIFRDLRTQLDPRAHPTVEAIAAACEQRRQHDLQIRLHRWLHGWLLIHLPLSIALVILMFIHVYVALKYW